MRHLNTSYMEKNTKDTDIQRAVKPANEMVSVLITIPRSWIEQLDVISDFYCKNRMTFIRDYIQEGIRQTTENYRSAYEDIAKMNKVFDEMSVKAAQLKERQEWKKSGW